MHSGRVSMSQKGPGQPFRALMRTHGRQVARRVGDAPSFSLPPGMATSAFGPTSASGHVSFGPRQLRALAEAVMQQSEESSSQKSNRYFHSFNRNNNF